MLAPHVSDGWHAELYRVHAVMSAQSSCRVQEEKRWVKDEANTVLALSVVLCAISEPSHVELIGCIEWHRW